MSNIKANRAEFWDWVRAKPAHDTPRGDFIRDTRETSNPDVAICGACDEAEKQFTLLKLEWRRKFPDKPLYSTRSGWAW